MSAIAISARNISKCYQVFDNQRARLLHALWPGHTAGMQQVWALKDINFEIKRGEAVAIIGRNGSGKSTLLEILAGTLTPTSGEFSVNGRVSALLELGSGFNPEYTGRDNVILNGLLLGLTREDILRRFDKIATFAEIGDVLDRPVKTYSSGMMMRLAFALQVNVQPDILIIDEALSVGDIFFQQKCLRRIKELQETGTTLLFVSHDMAMVRDLCQNALYLANGCQLLYGSKTEAITQFLNDGAFKGHAPPPEGRTLPTPMEKGHRLLPNSLWENPGNIDGKSDHKASILSIAVMDEQGVPTTHATIESKLVFRILYQVNREEPIDVALTLKNRYDQIVNISGTFSSSASKLPSNGRYLLEMTMAMMIEAGNYTFSFSLAEGMAPNVGNVIASSPWLGPIQIVWDYAERRAPFLGMFGIPYALQVDRVESPPVN